MPYKRTGRRRAYKRRRPVVRRKYKGRRRNKMRYTVSRIIGQPDSAYVKLRYLQTVQKTPIGFVANHIFRGNSCFDPDFTSGGGQPVGFDQYAAMYNDYEVTGSSIRIKLINNSALSAVGCVVYPSLSSSLIGYDDSMGNSYAKNIICGNINSTPIRQMSSFMRTKKLVGRTTASVNYAARIDTNPASPWFWNIEFKSTDNTSSLQLSVQVTLIFYVKFWNRVSMTDI